VSLRYVRDLLDRQPQQGAVPRVDIANTLFVLLPSGNAFFDLAQNGRYLGVNGTAATTGPGGLGVLGGSTYTSLGGVELPNNADFRFSGSAGTLIFHLREPDLSGIGSPIIFSVRDGTTTHLSFFINDDNATTFTQLAVQIGGTTLSAPNFTVLENQDDVVACSWGANGMRLYSRSAGGLVASNGTTTLPSTNTVRPYLLNRSTGGRANPGIIYSGFGYKRQLSDAQIVAAISGVGAPYSELFEPRRFISIGTTSAATQNESGGSSATVTVTASGAGNALEIRSGGSSSTVNVTAAGVGAALETVSGGSGSTVTVTAAGAGNGSTADSGGASATVTVTAAGAGSARESASGGAGSTVTVSAVGAGASADGASGGASTAVNVSAAGAGTALETASGGASANVLVTASGGRLALEIAVGGSSATVNVSAAGAGVSSEAGGAGTYPDPATVLAGVQYGPTGADYTGTLTLTSAGDIAAAVLAALNATTIPVDVKKVNSVTITGAGVPGNSMRPA
jgi:hypothetical protein